MKLSKEGRDALFSLRTVGGTHARDPRYVVTVNSKLLYDLLDDYEELLRGRSGETYASITMSSSLSKLASCVKDGVLQMRVVAERRHGFFGGAATAADGRGDVERASVHKTHLGGKLRGKRKGRKK